MSIYTKLIAGAVLLAGAGLLAALTALGIRVHHEIYESGYTAAMAKVKADSDKDHQALQKNADTAGATDATELANLRAYRDSHPEQPVRLCLSPTVQARANQGQRGSTGGIPAAGGVQPVPAGDSGAGAGGAGPDIGPLLEALAARADAVSASRRELRSVVAPLTVAPLTVAP